MGQNCFTVCLIVCFLLCCRPQLGLLQATWIFYSPWLASSSEARGPFDLLDVSSLTLLFSWNISIVERQTSCLRVFLLVCTAAVSADAFNLSLSTSGSQFPNGSAWPSPLAGNPRCLVQKLMSRFPWLVAVAWSRASWCCHRGWDEFPWVGHRYRRWLLWGLCRGSSCPCSGKCLFLSALRCEATNGGNAGTSWNFIRTSSRVPCKLFLS